MTKNIEIVTRFETVLEDCSVQTKCDNIAFLNQGSSAVKIIDVEGGYIKLRKGQHHELNALSADRFRLEDFEVEFEGGTGELSITREIYTTIDD